MTDKDAKRRPGRPKGTPKTGGRRKGTPNKVTADTKEWLSGLLAGLRGRIEQDFVQIDPETRIFAFTRLVGYVVPKQQALTVEERVKAEFKEMRRMLDNAPEKAVKDIAAKMLELYRRQEGRFSGVLGANEVEDM